MLTAGFRSVTLADLGITHQTDICVLREACCRELPNGHAVSKMVYTISQAFVDCYMKTFKQPNAPAHDVVAIMYLAKPELFKTRPARVEVELAGTLTRGMSVADWNGKWKKSPNVEVIVQVDLDRFVSEFVAAVGRLPRSM